MMDKKRLLRRLSYVVLAAVLLSGCSSGGETDSGAATEAINEFWVEYASTYSAGDIDAWVSLWTEDGVQMPPGEPPVVGKDQIIVRNQGVADTFAVEMDIDNEEVNVAGDLAYSRGTFTSVLTPREGGQSISVDGKFMTILVRQSDGSWKIHRDIFNSNVSPE